MMNKSAITLCVALLLAVSTGAFSQDADAVAIKNMVDSQRYVFVAQIALPMGGRSRHLDASYDVKIKKDTIIAYLPYYGRSYNAGYGGSDGGIDFTSKDFKYTKEDGKKGGWTVTISPKDVKDPSQKLVLSITESGSAYLTVSSNNRQNISFNGYIHAPGKK